MTLIEVLVACCLLSLLGAMVASIFQLGLRAQSQSDATTTAYRATLLALEGVKRELRGAQLVTPDVGAAADSATYKIPVVVNGLLKVDTGGQPVWGGQGTLNQTGEHELVRLDGAGQSRSLARLGPEGRIVFTRTQARVLNLDIVAYAVDSRGSSQSKTNFALLLSNQP